MSGAPVLLPLLLNRIKSAEAGISRCRKNDVCTLAYLGQGYFFPFTGIVPSCVSNAYIILDYPNVGIYRARSFFVPYLESMDQPDIHTAQKPDGPRLCCLGGQDADKV